MSVASLPPLLQTKLDVLARRLHRLRLLRGVSIVGLVTGSSALAVAFGLDAWLELPPGARCFVTGAWFVAIVVAAGRTYSPVSAIG